MKDFDGAEIRAYLGDGLKLVSMEGHLARAEAARIGWSGFQDRRCSCIRDANRRTVAMFAYNGFSKSYEAGFAPLKYGFVVPEFEHLRPFVERIERAEHLPITGMHKDGEKSFTNGHVCHHKDWLPHRLDGPADQWQRGYAWFKDGYRHRDGDLPAHENYTLKEWWCEGRRHRGGGQPAVENHGESVHHKEWWVNGVRHRGGGEPAVEYGDVREWWVEGKRHRDGDLPALMALDGRRWYRNGRSHRDGGRPAVELEDGTVEYWVNGVQTGNRFLPDWKNVSQALVGAIEMGPNGKFENQELGARRRAGMSHRINAVVRALEKRDGANSIAGPSAGMLEAVRKACESDREDSLAKNRPVSSEIKCFRLGAIVASGRFADLTVAERDSLLELLELMPKGRKWINLVSPGGPGNPPAGAPLDRDGLARLIAGATLSEAPPLGDGPVGFALDWRPPMPEGRIMWPHLVAPGHGDLERVSELDAPVVATLPTDDGHSLDVRFVEGDFCRPVLAPGSFRPIGEAEFRTAAAAGVAWRDNPYRERPNPAFCAMAVDEIATAEKSKFAGKAEERAAISAAIARAGRLFVVDGMVYRRTVEPTAEMVKTRNRRLYSGKLDEVKAIEEAACWRIAWRFPGDIAQTDSQAIVATCRHRVADWRSIPCAWSIANDVDRRGFGLTLPLPLHKEAESLLARTAARATRDKARDLRDIPTGETFSFPSSWIEIRDPSVFAATPEIHLAQIRLACESLEAVVSRAHASEYRAARSKAEDVSLATEAVDLDHPSEVKKLCEDAVELVGAMDALYAREAPFGLPSFELALLETAAEILKDGGYELEEGLAFNL